MRVLGAQRRLDRPVELDRPGRPTRRGLLPQEVEELLRGVRMPRGQRERLPAGLRRQVLARLAEPGERVGLEQVGRYHPELHLLRAAPERLVLVVEDPLHHVALAAQVDVSHLRLLLEDRAHQLDQRGVDVDHLLKLVQHQRHAPVAIGGDAPEHDEQLLERRVDVLLGGARVEAERHRAVVGVDGDRGGQAQAREHLQALLRVPQPGGQLLVDRLRELRSQQVLRGGAHQVHLGDQDALPHELLRHPPEQRRLAVPARGEDDHVLAVAGIGDERVDLDLSVRERRVQRQGPESEGVDGHAVIMSVNVMFVSIMLHRIIYGA